MFRTVLWSLPDTEKIVGGDYASESSSWTHATINLVPSNYERKVRNLFKPQQGLYTVSQSVTKAFEPL